MTDWVTQGLLRQRETPVGKTKAHGNLRLVIDFEGRTEKKHRYRLSDLRISVQKRYWEFLHNATNKLEFEKRPGFFSA